MMAFSLEHQASGAVPAPAYDLAAGRFRGVAGSLIFWLLGPPASQPSGNGVPSRYAVHASRSCRSRSQREP